jgi:sugar diacid utilization regulator
LEEFVIPPRPESPTPDELKRSWATTTGFLEAAKQELPVEQCGHYEEYILHNELELALEELQQEGEQSPRSIRFWQMLLAAAENMKLVERTSQLRSRIDHILKK